MILRIISKERILFNGPVEQVKLPGTAGPFTVLERHAPLISTLEEGFVYYTVKGQQSKVHIEGGIVEVRDNWISVCVG